MGEFVCIEPCFNCLLQ